jgi:hypothetical protein
MAPGPGISIKSDTTGEEVKIEWANVIHKLVRASDDVDMGDVERVGNEFMVVRQGVAKVHHYFIPKASISNYDGSSLYLNVPSDFVKSRFEKDSEPTTDEIRTLAREAEAKAEEQKRIDASNKKENEGHRDREAGGKNDPLTSHRDQ